MNISVKKKKKSYTEINARAHRYIATHTHNLFGEI